MSQDVTSLIQSLQSAVPILFDLLSGPAALAVGGGAALGIAGRLIAWFRS